MLQGTRHRDYRTQGAQALYHVAHCAARSLLRSPKPPFCRDDAGAIRSLQGGAGTLTGGDGVGVTRLLAPVPPIAMTAISAHRAGSSPLRLHRPPMSRKRPDWPLPGKAAIAADMLRPSLVTLRRQ